MFWSLLGGGLVRNKSVRVIQVSRGGDCKDYSHWVMTPCSVKIYRRFKGECCLRTVLLYHSLLWACHGFISSEMSGNFHKTTWRLFPEHVL